VTGRDVTRVAGGSLQATRGVLAVSAAAHVGTPVVTLEWGEVAGIEVAHRALHDTERVVCGAAPGAPQMASLAEWEWLRAARTKARAGTAAVQRMTFFSGATVAADRGSDLLPQELAESAA